MKYELQALHVIFFPAPKYVEITTPAPTERPMKNPVIKNIRFPALETAARAELPTKFPTMRESAVLYNC